MRRYVCWLISLLLVATAFSLSSPAQQRSRKATKSTAFSAKPGFYIQFDMYHATMYGGWQNDVVSAFGRAGVKAFVSNDVRSHYTEQTYWTLKALRLRAVKSESIWLPVYAGPFESESSAKQVFSTLPSILNTVLKQYDKQRAEIGDTTRWSHRLENCTGNQCDLAGFIIQLVRVS